MPLPFNVDSAIEEIDAAMFTGDTFIDPHNIELLENMMRRWQKELDANKKIIESLK